MLRKGEKMNMPNKIIAANDITSITPEQTRMWLGVISVALQMYSCGYTYPYDMRLTSCMPVREFEGVTVIQVQATADSLSKTVDPYFIHVPGNNAMFNKCQFTALDADLRYRLRPRRELLETAKREITKALSRVHSLQISKNARDFVRIELMSVFADLGNLGN